MNNQTEMLTNQSAFLDKHLQQPSTPKKKPKYPGESPRSVRRVKSITKMVQKQSASLIYTVLVLVWVVVVSGILLMTLQTKISNIQAESIREIDLCRIEYQKNRCNDPVKGLIVFCQQKMTCMQQQVSSLAQRRIKYVKLAGEILQQFANGAGLAGIALGVLLLWMCLKQRGKEKSIVTMQFFDQKTND